MSKSEFKEEPSPTPQAEGDVSPRPPKSGGSRPQNRFVEESLKGVPKKYAGTYRRALEGKAPKAGAIKAKCLECVGFEEAQERIRNCTVTRCPLWSYRPYQTKGEE